MRRVGGVLNGKGVQRSIDKNHKPQVSRVAQWKRAGPITQRSMDRNHSLLRIFFGSKPFSATNFF